MHVRLALLSNVNLLILWSIFSELIERSQAQGPPMGLTYANVLKLDDFHIQARGRESRGRAS